MKIAISSSGRDLSSRVDPRFGRCAYFLIVNTEDMGFDIYENENAALGGGAGIQTAQLVASEGAEAVITGNCGPNAVRTLSAAGIKLYAGQSGTIHEVIEAFKKGNLQPTTEANVADHSGMGKTGPARGTQGTGFGRGMGMGRGQGSGRGGGAGKGRSQGMGMSGRAGKGKKGSR
ncbi:NifB/NifX family molybdenum-iron cluster-binding protein [Thermodesulfobacteriota bacterium]